MIRPPDDVIAALARGNHVLGKWLADWHAQELERLPYASPQNVAVMQGRCQVLTELRKLVQDSPNLAAQPRSG
jgi:hypothetical protein